MRFCLYDAAAVYDHAASRWYAVVVDWPDAAGLRRPSADDRLAAIRNRLAGEFFGFACRLAARILDSGLLGMRGVLPRELLAILQCGCAAHQHLGRLVLLDPDVAVNAPS